MSRNRFFKEGNSEVLVAAAENPSRLPAFNPKLIGALADEVARTVAKRLPHLLSRRRRPTKVKTEKRIENAIFLDTSAIIDGRIFAVIEMGFLGGVIIIPASILLELKHIADSQNMVKRERGRNGLDFLDKLRKNKKVKVSVLSEEEEKKYSKKEQKEVDEKLIQIAKFNKGRIITCDYNLEKKARIQGITAINIHELAQHLKIRAVPGESLHVEILHKGKDITQGVGYLDDGTMIVIENASSEIGKTVDVVVSRVIQTAAGRILFAKKI